MAKLTNEQKFRTAEERARAFGEFCEKWEVCRDCKARCGRNESRIFTSECMAHWLALEAEEEKPEPCFYCGGDTTVCEHSPHFDVECEHCGYVSALCSSRSRAIDKHNRVARAVRAAREGETK